MIQEPPFSSTPITWPGHHGRVQVSSAENRRDDRHNDRDDSDECRMPRHGGGAGSQEAKDSLHVLLVEKLRSWWRCGF